MNTPAPITTPTPQLAPAIWGLAQSLVSGFITYKSAVSLGLPENYAAMVGSAVGSSITSAVHAWTQKLHRSGQSS